MYVQTLLGYSAWHFFSVMCRILYEIVPVYREQLLISRGTLSNNVRRVECSNMFDSVILFTSLERGSLIGQKITN